MITIPIKYTSPFSETPIEKKFYFNLTAAEAIRLETDWYEFGGVEGRYDMLSTGDDVKFIRETIEELIYRAYGERVGDELEKSQSLIDRFKSSEAYSILLMGLLTSDEEKYDANAFFKGIMPKNVDLKNPEKTASEIARERSQANMQGFQKKAAPETSSDEIVTAVPVEEQQIEAPSRLTFEEQRQQKYEEFLAQKAAKEAAIHEDPEFEAFLRNNQ